MPGQQSFVSYAISLGMVVLVLALRWRRMRRSRPLMLERLWIFPSIYLAIAVAIFAFHPPGPIGRIVALAALAVGAALGWQRGRMMGIEVDPESHGLSQRGSPAAMLLLVGIVIARLGARDLAQRGGVQVDPLAVTDVLIAFVLGLFATTRLEMYLRAKRLLATVHGSGSA